MQGANYGGLVHIDGSGAISVVGSTLTNISAVRTASMRVPYSHSLMSILTYSSTPVCISMGVPYGYRSYPVG